MQRGDALINGHDAPLRVRVSSSASTKLLTTPAATVTPIARNTGSVENDSSANTISVESEQTMTACSVRRCSAGSSAACSKKSA